MDRPVNILVIEDSQADFLLLERLLRQHGTSANCVRVEKIEELAEAVRANNWDIVLSDYSLPRLNFSESLKLIRRELPDVPVILVSGSVGEEMAVELLKLGVSDFVLKDNLIRLLPSIRRALGEANERRARRHSEALYRSLFENMLNSVVHCRMIFRDGLPVDMEYISVNPAFEAVTGIKENVVGRRISEVIPGYCQDNPESLEMFGRVALTGEPTRWEHYLTSLDRWFTFSIYSPAHGEVVIVTENITSRKKAEQEREDYSRRLELLLETAGEGIFGVNTEGRITFINQAAIRLLGLPKAELIGRNSHEVFHSHRSDEVDYPWNDCPLCKTLSDGISRSGEETYYKADGSGFPIEFTSTAIIEGDVTSGAVMLFRDITERRKIEDDLRQAQKLEGIGQLAGGIAHDFNNVLGAVIGFSGLLQMKIDRSGPLANYVDEIIAAGRRGVAMTQQILAFSRKQVLDMRAVNLNEIVRNLEKMLRRLVREDISIQYDLADENMVVHADASQIDQILINLATNARDAMPGGGRLGIATKTFVMDSEYIKTHGYGSPGKYAVITVWDTGSGMDNKTRLRIFEPFFTTKECGKGTGLGLAVVHGIVKQHNGYINVYSETGRGTVFKIYLPLTEHVVDRADSQPDELIRGGTETILIAEDDDSLRSLSITVLSQYGYTVIDAADGEEAVLKFAENRDKIKLVILDGIMPQKNGKEAYAEIQQLCPDMKAIFISGYTEEIFPLEGIHDKTAVFMHKPVTSGNLLRKVREVLDG
ncbi:MAG: response regulator [Nitrospirae bacterium]|nr:response regulator [Nitrospirota bacterium]